MQMIVISFGLVLLATGLSALPATLDSDGDVSYEENGVVYIFDIYAVRKSNSASVGKILNDGGIEKIKSSADKIGTVVMADEDSEVPITLGEFSDIVEDLGMTVEKLNDGDELKIIEIKFEDMSMEDFDDFMSFEELIRVLKAEGIILELNEENSSRFIQVSFDEKLKNSDDQPFTLDELAEFFEKEGYTVDVIKAKNKVMAIRIHVDDIPDVVTTKQTSPKKDNKKYDINDKKDDHFSTFDHITKSDSMNKIRKRRTPCSECQTGTMIKNMIEKYKETK